MDKLNKHGKSVLLAYDQGLEHGPKDFNLESIDPERIIRLAEQGKIEGLILHHGIAEKYLYGKKLKVPLVIKLNGKTSLAKGEPFSPMVCSIDRAVRLGAEALGYTIYPGSGFEAQQFREFGEVVDKGHRLGLPVVAWVYPRGEGIDATATATMAYAARVALELGADYVKLHFNWDVEGFKWACKAAGKVRVLIVGGERTPELDFLRMLSTAMGAGASGIAVGRNVWQHPKPQKMLEAVKAVVHKNAKPEDALKLLEK